MKICGIICEFNPFHNGHAYVLEWARELSGCESIVCIMSGSFTQRGDICVVNKYLRAKHAVLGGAVKILSSIPELDTLAFGCEDGDEEDFFKAAKLLIEENEAFKTALKVKLSEGESYIKSYAFAFKSIGGDVALLSKPNNTLGVEYAKAVLRTGKNIKLLPIRRVGATEN